MLFNICGGLVLRENKKQEILVILRKKSPYKGYYAFPGGKLDEGEQIEAGILRELKEETGLDRDKIRKIKYLGLLNELYYFHSEYQHQFIVNYFLLEVEDFQVKFNEDEGEVRWMSIEEAMGEKTRFLPSDLEFLKYAADTDFSPGKGIRVEGSLINDGTVDEERLRLGYWDLK